MQAQTKFFCVNPCIFQIFVVILQRKIVFNVHLFNKSNQYVKRKQSNFDW